MKSSLKRVLPREIDEETEAIFLEKLRTKMLISCRLLVRVVRALEGKFGREPVHEAAREVLHKVNPRPAAALRTPQEDLAEYAVKLEEGCAGTHEWERVSEHADEIAYRFTRCMWAEVFRELDASDIGGWLCAGDDPAARSYNPQLRCHLTRTLMQGDECCDHVFRVAKASEE